MPGFCDRKRFALIHKLPYSDEILRSSNHKCVVMQSTRYDPGFFELGIFGGSCKSKSHLCRYQSVLITRDEENGSFDILNLIDAFPSKPKHHLLDWLDQSKEAKESISHVTDRCESILDDKPFYKVVTLLIEQSLNMNTYSTPKRSSYNKHSIIIDSIFFFAKINRSLGILYYTILFGLPFTLWVPSVSNCNYIHFQFVINEFKII